MPDWSYHPIFKPILFQLKESVAQRITYSMVERLGNLPFGFGKLLIRFMGHMQPPPSIQCNKDGMSWKSPVGLASGNAVRPEMIPALQEFGFGGIEFGPVSLGEENGMLPGELSLDVERMRIGYSAPLPAFAYEDYVNRIAQVRKKYDVNIPVGVRLKICLDQLDQMHFESQFKRISEVSDYVVIHLTTEDEGYHATQNAGEWSERWTEVQTFGRLCEWVSHCNQTEQRPLYLYVENIEVRFPETVALIEAAIHKGWQGVVLADGIPDGQDPIVWHGPEVKKGRLESIRNLRERFGESLTIIANAGVMEPADAIDVIHSGADLVQIHSGWVFAGPGLPKRCNEALAWVHDQKEPVPSVEPARTFWRDWGWSFLFGLGMILSGLIVWIIGATSVILPYDLAFVEMSHAQIDQINPNLLHFMMHDRVTLAGTMISIGVFYVFLARFGISQGLHWSKLAMTASASIGFVSFFLFLGFGYFDRWHAIMSGLLFPVFLWGMFRASKIRPATQTPSLHNDSAWRRMNIGQLMFVLIGFSLCIGGAVIAYLGSTTVFVKEDLEYLQSTSAELMRNGADLIALVAHDRAGFGGALFAHGAGILLAALWGIRQCQRWLWWAFALSGLPGFIAALGIHFHIGYVNWFHLLPVYLVLVLYLIGLWGLRPARSVQ